MSDCLFCKIIAGEITSNKVFESDDCIAFKDINPAAPYHILVVPKRHIATLNDFAAEDAELLGQLLLTVQQIAAKEGVSERGYRTVINCNKDAQQTVFHLHIHLLAGRSFHWPPG